MGRVRPLDMVVEQCAKPAKCMRTKADIELVSDSGAVMFQFRSILNTASTAVLAPRRLVCRPLQPDDTTFSDLCRHNHSRASDAAPKVTAVLGPTNTGKTFFAIERMLAHKSGMIGLPLRLLAREVYDRIVRLRGRERSRADHRRGKDRSRSIRASMSAPWKPCRWTFRWPAW